MKTMITIQKKYLEQELENLNRMLEDLKKCSGKAYKLAGNVFIEAKKEELIEEIEKSIGDLKLKIELYNKQLERLGKNEKEEKIQNEKTKIIEIDIVQNKY